VVRSHSRPHAANANPFPGARFKTLKHRPQFPRRLQTIDGAPTFCRLFFAWHDEDHHHAGIGLMTPDQIHFGQADAIDAARQTALDAALPGTPERFVRQRPKPPQIPTTARINPPKPKQATQAQPQNPVVSWSLTRSGMKKNRTVKPWDQTVEVLNFLRCCKPIRKADALLRTRNLVSKTVEVEFEALLDAVTMPLHVAEVPMGGSRKDAVLHPPRAVFFQTNRGVFTIEKLRHSHGRTFWPQRRAHGPGF